MKILHRLAFVCVAASVLIACGDEPKSSGTTNPSGTTPSIAGVVTDSASGAPISSATIGIQGRTTTTGSDGRYSITGLTAGQASLTAQHQGHINVSQPVTGSGTGATTSNIAMAPSFAARLAGNWSGTWRNTTFGSTGGMTMTMSVDTIAQTLQIVLDVNGNVFGAGDPAPITFNGPYSTTNGLSISQSTSSFGTVTLNVTPSGQITGSATGIPGGAITRFDFTGTVTPTTINVTYTVTFVGGATATGTATLTK